MKVAYVSPAWPVGAMPNGIVKAVDAMKGSLEASGHLVHVLSPQLVGVRPSDTLHQVEPCRKSACRVVNGISRRITGDGRRMDPLMESVRRKLVALHKRGEVDIVEIEETWGMPLHIIDRIPIPVVVRLHGPWFLTGLANGAEQPTDEFQERVRREGTCIARAHGVSGPSQCVVGESRRWYGLELPEAEVIPNPMGGTPGRSWDAEACDRDTVLFVGRFDRLKGGDVVLSAFNKVATQNPRAKLIFCGPDRGLARDGGETQSCAAYVEELRLPEHVASRINILGRQTPESVDRLRNQASVTVMASRWENFANTLIEAVVNGSPLIATDSGGTPEIVQHGVTGLLVPPGNPDELADAILKLLGDHDLCRRLGANARVDAMQRFDPARIAAESIGFYGRVLDRFNVRKRLGLARSISQC